MPLFGKDLDEVFAYQTPKIVVLKDKRLGLLRLGLLVLIVLYIFFWTILYQGKHLSVRDVDSIYRLSIHHPTKNSCNAFSVGCKSNFTSYLDLPYCLESAAPFAASDGTPQPKRECQVWDSVEMSVEVNMGMMLPTRVRRYEQRRGCLPSGRNGWRCNGAPYDFVDADGRPQTEAGVPEPYYDAFIADVEDFTLLVDHTFRRAGGLQADDAQMNGFWLECPGNLSTASECTPRAIPCAHRGCPWDAPAPNAEATRVLRGASQGRPAGAAQLLGGAAGLDAWSVRQVELEAEGEEEADAEVPLMFAQRAGLPGEEPVLAVRRGDVFPVRTLLKAASTSLEDGGGFRGTYRERGMVVVIHIEYGNMPKAWAGLLVTPWSQPWPTYTYHITLRHVDSYKVTKTFDDPANEDRKIRMYNGIRFVIEQSGQIAAWDTSNFVITLTAALGLMAVATTVTEVAMMYFMPRGEEYKRRKFHQSKDFDPDNEAAGRQLTAQQAGELFSDAVQSQDGEAIAVALGDLLPFVKDGKAKVVAAT